MNYIFIDKKEGLYGILHSRKDIEVQTSGRITSDKLDHLFSRKKVKTYVDEKFIIIPIRKLGEIFSEPKLINELLWADIENRKTQYAPKKKLMALYRDVLDKIKPEDIQGMTIRELDENTKQLTKIISWKQ